MNWRKGWCAFRGHRISKAVYADPYLRLSCGCGQNSEPVRTCNPGFHLAFFDALKKAIPESEVHYTRYPW